jgi:hypothetical protein
MGIKQCCGSGMFIPDHGFEYFPSRYEFFHPGSEFFPSRIPDLHKRINNFHPKKLFLSFRKYDPNCSSRIRILIFYPSRIPGSKKAPDPGSGILVLTDTKVLTSSSESAWTPLSLGTASVILRPPVDRRELGSSIPPP